MGLLCHCSDPGCRACGGECGCDSTTTLYRVDMDDETGTPFCDGCAEDAMESGLFTSNAPNTCPMCGEELDQDCMGWDRCEYCDDGGTDR